MPIQQTTYYQLQKFLSEKGVTLVAVSKTKPVSDIEELYALGQRDFGENYVQELVDKQPLLPADIRWHFIGHLQRNKVKYIVPFVYLIHSVDSLRLLLEIEKQAAKIGRPVNVLLQMYIAGEETKFGLDEVELNELMQHIQLHPLQFVSIKGMMGMASFVEDQKMLEKEFATLYSLYSRFKNTAIPNVNLEICSMGMSGDYALAIQQGSNMVRVGSLLFGARK
ncbi:MAG: YggS family pyridoxal phosphate-dependent enzyme [Bacteroidetes bacterium]|nr:YggS family pyridoxal phosphate-dependent enzyme [Bacteroidota bacterium]